MSQSPSTLRHAQGTASSGDVWFVEPACTELVEVSKRTSTGILYFLDIPKSKNHAGVLIRLFR
jgi:hypothetical protein